jgi:glycosyltransferase involved in cell wall biosynthesis
MNILICPHQLVMGGSQINAIELAAAVRGRGHSVTVTAPDGVLTPMVRSLGLDYVPTPSHSHYASVATAWHLTSLVRARGIDVVHTYEWRPSIEAMAGPNLLCGTPLLMTVLSMSVPGFLPSHPPLLLGTRELIARHTRNSNTHLMEPPIDTSLNATVSISQARRSLGLDDDDLVVSVVCRLTSDLQKLEGVLQAMEVVDVLAASLPLRLLVVGGGEGLERVRLLADAINKTHGREIIMATGSMMDPRIAYEAADIVIGMGSSALKGMSFAKPLVVQGENGFWRLLDERSLPGFLEQGMFGHGGAGAADLSAALRSLAADPGRCADLGRLGRQVVVSRFGLHGAADRLIDIYDDLVRKPPAASTRIASIAVSALRYARYRSVEGWRASWPTSASLQP